ncbi:MAG TPA: polyphosphate kinase 2 [Drouetiella sp.]
MAKKDNGTGRAPSSRTAQTRRAGAGPGATRTRRSSNRKAEAAVVEQASAELMSDNSKTERNGEARTRQSNGKSGASNGKSSAKAETNGHNGVSRSSFDKLAINTASGKINADDLAKVNTHRGLMKLLKSKNIKLKSVLNEMNYEEELVLLQIELVKLQRWVQKYGKRIAILFEGRDAAGKGGAIRRFTEHLNPRSMRVVALPKPSEVERGQWYFQRYSVQLPSAGEIVFFDRSWYNRAVVEPVNGFCTNEEYDRFMQQVTEYEHMLYEDGIMIIKFWFSIAREEQQARFESRRDNPLKQWKLSPIDDKAQELWNKYSHYKELMFSRTHTSFSPWIIVQANNKKKARLESIRYVLSTVDYPQKDTAKTELFPDPNIVQRYHRNSANQD